MSNDQVNLHSIYIQNPDRWHECQIRCHIYRSLLPFWKSWHGLFRHKTIFFVFSPECVTRSHASINSNSPRWAGMLSNHLPNLIPNHWKFPLKWSKVDIHAFGSWYGHTAHTLAQDRGLIWPKLAEIVYSLVVPGNISFLLESFDFANFTQVLNPWLLIQSNSFRSTQTSPVYESRINCHTDCHSLLYLSALVLAKDGTDWLGKTLWTWRGAKFGPLLLLYWYPLAWEIKGWMGFIRDNGVDGSW